LAVSLFYGSVDKLTSNGRTAPCDRLWQNNDGDQTGN
jgi:hypothetical protein